MNDFKKSKEQLITELNALRKENAQFKKSESFLLNSTFKGKEDLFRLITENTTDNIAIVSFDLKATYLYVNPSIKTVLGYEPEDLVGKSFFDFVHPDDKKIIFKLLSTYVRDKVKKVVFWEEQKISETIEYRFNNKHGKWRILHSTITVAGKHLLAVSRDITEGKKAEQELIESEERFRNLFEFSQANMLLIDPEKGSVIDANAAACRFYGWSKEEFVTKNVFAINTLPTEEIKQQMQLAVSQKNHYFEFQHRLADGSVRDVQIFSSPIPLSHKKIVFALIFDITARKQAETALRESEKNFRLLFENSPLGTYIATPDGNIIDGNTALLKILGSPSLEATKQINVLTFPPLVENGYADKFRQCVQDMKTIPFEITYQSKWGKLSHLSAYLIPLSNQTGTVEKVYTIMEDITARKKAEEERYKLETQLRRSQKLETIGTLTGGIAHDFNNILSPILGYTELALLKTNENEPIAKDLQHVLRGTKRAKELVEQILLFSKQSEKEHQPLYFQELIIEALRLLRPSIPASIKIKKRIDHSCPKVLADPTQMHQILINLCTNAWQAMEGKNGVLTIRLEESLLDSDSVKLLQNIEPGHYVKLTISDTGNGMDDATIERIFEPFFTTKKPHKGTGLGLSVVHGIVRSHNGEIMVESKPGRGSSFHIFLPVSTKDNVSASVQNETFRGGNESILIVDDEEDISMMVKTILENYGYRVKAFKNPQAILKAFLQAPQAYDLVISDFTMPQMNGLELAEKIHHKKPETAVIIMTGFGEKLAESVLQQNSIDLLLSKPISVTELAKAVRTILDKQKT